MVRIDSLPPYHHLYLHREVIVDGGPGIVTDLGGLGFTACCRQYDLALVHQRDTGARHLRRSAVIPFSHDVLTVP